MAAGAGMRFAEVRQQRLSPAAGGFAETDECVELTALQALATWPNVSPWRVQ